MQKKLVIVFFFLLLIFLLALSLQRFLIFQLYYFDFGVFSQIIWQLSRFQVPFINHVVLGRIMFLSDHFEPSLILLAPLYWITSNIAVLSIEQGIVTFINSILIYKIALKLKLHRYLALFVTFLFIMFPGTTNPLLTDWHPEPTAGMFLLLFIFLYLYTPKRFVAFLCALIFLGFKESNALILFVVATWMYLLTRKKELLVVGLTSLVLFFVTIKVLIPGISGKFYLYTPEISLSPTTIVKNIASNPHKVSYIKNSFLSFGLLPLASGIGLIPIVGDLGIKIIPTKTLFENFDFTFHYHVYLGIFLAIATLYGLVFIKKLKKPYLLVGVVIISLIVSLYTARKVTGSPINMGINPVFWKELTPNKPLFRLISQVPKSGSVMSQNNLLPYISTRSDMLYIVNYGYERYKPDVIFFDTTPGQNPNNFWETNTYLFDLLIKTIKKDKNYTSIKTESPHYFLFVRK